MYVPELDVTIGLGRGPGLYGGVELCLCARNVEARPPVIRRSWNKTFLRELVDVHSSDNQAGNVVYLGNGRFCICWVTGVEHDRPETYGMAVRRFAGGELQLTKRGKLRYHLMSPHGRCFCFVQPQIP
uniref:Uncharacterized protein n=1 Tax=Oryza glumipatula TaxID=40148 RepID=A0A0E0B6F7_9ORYZ